MIQFVIDEFTCEPGVRKLKEILYEILSEVNLDNLTGTGKNKSTIISLNTHIIATTYLADKPRKVLDKITTVDTTGMGHGMWANAHGMGGVIPIQSMFFPSSSKTFLELKLTGLQGDVMKESMNIALTLAWKLTPMENRAKIENLYPTSGIHIHTPEGSTPKDGPSAGACITAVLFSLLNDRPFRHEYAITGEISLNGNVTKIGGLDLKITGSIKAGITRFIYPADNENDFQRFLRTSPPLPEGLAFFPVNRIEQIIQYTLF